MNGPYTVKLRVPKLDNWESVQKVPPEGGEAVFTLPPGPRGRLDVVVQVGMKDLWAAEPDQLRRAMMKAAHGKEHHLVVRVRE